MIDIELVKASYDVKEELAYQRTLVLMREYYTGEQHVTLTKRQQEYLGYNQANPQFALNYCATVVDSIAERMIVNGVDSGDDDALGEWIWQVWQHNRMDAKQLDVFQKAVNESEYFLMVDWPEGAEYPRILRHNRFTAAEAGGTGEGCKAHYINGNVDLGLECVSKRWTETYQDGKRRATRSRLNLYYADRVERYVLGGSGGFENVKWEPFTETVRYVDEGGQVIEEQRPAIVPWVDGTGQPLGIPFAHVMIDKGFALRDAIIPQDLINKTALDVIASADAAGFPIRVAKGFMPTTDGKPPESDGSNYLQLFPGAWLVVPRTDAGQGVDELEAADLSQLLAVLDSMIIKLAQVTDTPISRFQLTRQVAAEGTLKQQEAPLLAKIRSYQTQIGNAIEDVFYKARRLAEARGQTFGGEGVILSTQWAPAETRDDVAVLDSLTKKGALGVPREQLWSEMGYDSAKIAEMRAMAAEERVQQGNIGGELLRAFERGV